VGDFRAARIIRNKQSPDNVSKHCSPHESFKRCKKIKSSTSNNITRKNNSAV
jgi:hypothetical protein